MRFGGLPAFTSAMQYHILEDRGNVRDSVQCGGIHVLQKLMECISQIGNWFQHFHWYPSVASVSTIEILPVPPVFKTDDATHAQVRSSGREQTIGGLE